MTSSEAGYCMGTTMDADGRGILISVKPRVLRHPVAIAVGVACAIALLGLNIAALTLGDRAPWLLGSALLADMLIVGGGIFAAARLVRVTEKRTEANQARLEAIVDSAMDAIITV